MQKTVNLRAPSVVLVLFCLPMLLAALSACDLSYCETGNEPACAPRDWGPAEVRDRASKITIGMTALEVFKVTGPWPGVKTRQSDYVASCENVDYLTSSGVGKYTHIFYDRDGRVKRVEHDQRMPCAFE